MFNDKPYQWALANFKCELSQDRLRRTPKEDLELALGRDQRGTLQTMSAVYVLENSANSLLKIGYADNLKSRLSGLNCGSPVDLKLMHFLYFVDGFISKSVESDVHKELAEYRRKGEWFEVTSAQVGEAIAATVNARRIKWWSERERRRLGQFARDSYAKYEQRRRFFGT
jgi:hypothetical protein